MMLGRRPSDGEPFCSAAMHSRALDTPTNSSPALSTMRAMVVDCASSESTHSTSACRQCAGSGES